MIALYPAFSIGDVVILADAFSHEDGNHKPKDGFVKLLFCRFSASRDHTEKCVVHK